MRLTASFFQRDVLEVSPDLLGKYLVRKTENNTIERYIITDVEAYRGEEDEACHARKGQTQRNEIMYADGGKVYVYLIYGMYQMLNFVTAQQGNPQAVLIRGIQNIDGPGRVTRHLHIDKSFYGEDLSLSERIWVEDNAQQYPFEQLPRIGIDYAGEYWRNIPWRYKIVELPRL